MTSKQILHGSCVEIFEGGLLILGPSGVGKSNLVLTFLDRGHFFVADDAVELNVENHQIFARPVSRIKTCLHLRDLGIIHLKDYNLSLQLKEQTKLIAAIELSPFPFHANDLQEDEMINGKQKSMTLLGVELPFLNLDVGAHKPITLIVELFIKKILREKKS